MHNLRCKAGISVISAQDGIRPAAEALRHNELLALLIDAPTKGKLVKVRFLGDYAQFSALDTLDEKEYIMSGWEVSDCSALGDHGVMQTLLAATATFAKMA